MSKLTKMVTELVQIDEDLAGRVSHLQNKVPKIKVGGMELATAEPRDCYELYTFEQLWGNTSGGFEGWGGCAMTDATLGERHPCRPLDCGSRDVLSPQRTYVFIPEVGFDNICYVYFGGRFAYSVPYSDEFMQDIKKHSIAGAMSYGKYLKGG